MPGEPARSGKSPFQDTWKSMTGPTTTIKAASNDQSDVGRHVLGDNGRRADDRPVADRHALQDDSSGTDPHVIPDDYGLTPLARCGLLGPPLPGIERMTVEVRDPHPPGE